MAIFNDLPIELVVDILARLPVESIMRFKCIRKSWYALLKNYEFVCKHLLNTQSCISDNNSTVLLKTVNKNGKLTLFLHSSDDPSAVRIRIPDYSRERSFRFNGHCNGVVFLADCFGMGVICNPSTREYRALPCPIFLHPSVESKALGFGYDPKTKDYKVVRIVDMLINNGGMFRDIPKVEVYTLSTNSWRELENVYPGAKVSDIARFNTYFDGFFYWWAKDDITNERVILSFDMDNEVFNKIPIPDCSFSNRNNTVTLTVWKESISLILYPKTAAYICFDIWLLDRNSDRFSWTKQLTIGPLLGVERPLVFRDSNELLMLGKNRQLVSYNFCTPTLNTMPINGIPKKISGVTNYMKSLVSVQGGY